jgi:ABC-type uncharacterized transport system ATPase subunit
MVFIPSDRFDRAAALSGSVEDNAIVQERLVIHPLGLRTSRRVRETMHRLTERFDVHARRGDPLTALSGGTIQKLILARELDGDPSVCVLAEPTAGLDLRSQRALAETLRQLAEGGAAVIVLTSSLHIFDVLRCTVHVLHAGRVVGTFPSTDEHGVARAIAGIGAETPSPPNGVSAP